MVGDPLLISRLPQIVRFLLLGGLAAAINWLVRFPLSAFLPFNAAVVIAYVVGMSTGFMLYRKHVFPGSSRPIIEQSVVFLGVNLFGALVVLSLSWLLLKWQAGTGWPLFVRQGLAHGAAIGVAAITNFLGHKTLTFASAKP